MLDLGFFETSQISALLGDFFYIFQEGSKEKCLKTLGGINISNLASPLQTFLEVKIDT